MSYTQTFQKYAVESKKYGLLSEIEERILCNDYYIGRHQNQLNRLVHHNLRLVLSIASHFPREEDVLSEGMIGLVEGIKRFNPSCGTKLSTYVTYWIKAYIFKYVLDSHRLVRLGSTPSQRKLFFNLNKVKNQLKSLGQELSPETIANHLQVNAQDVIEMEQRLLMEARLDAPLKNLSDGDTTLLDTISCDGLTPDEALERMEEQFRIECEVKEFRTTLSAFEQKVFDARFATDKEEQITLRDLGDSLGVSHECVRQSQNKMLPKLRRFMERSQT